MKIKIITPYAEPEGGACSIRIDNYSKYFTSNGVDIEILAPKRSDITVDMKNIKRYDGIKSLLLYLLKHDFDLVMGSSPPMFHIFFASLVCKLKRKKFVLDIRDIWTQSIESLGLKSKNDMKLKLYKLIENITYKMVDEVFVVTDFVDLIPSKIRKIPISHGSDVSIMKRDTTAGLIFRKKLGIPKHKPVLIYTGGVGDEDIENFLRYSAKTAVKKFDAHLLFIIATDKTIHTKNILNNIFSIVRKSGIGKKFHLVENIDYLDIYKYLSVADIAIHPLRNSLKYHITQKTYDYMAAGLPILAKAHSNGKLSQFFKKYDIGYFSSNWESFNENMEKALKNIESFKRKGRHSRRIIQLNFTREKTTELVFKETMNLLQS